MCKAVNCGCQHFKTRFTIIDSCQVVVLIPMELARKAFNNISETAAFPFPNSRCCLSSVLYLQACLHQICIRVLYVIHLFSFISPLKMYPLHKDIRIAMAKAFLQVFINKGKPDGARGDGWVTVILY